MTQGVLAFSAEPVVSTLDKSVAAQIVKTQHYLHRVPPISHCFGCFNGHDIAGVVTFGVPASRHLQMSACPTDPDIVLELNRLWVEDSQPRNTASWFVARALALIPPSIVVSYADSAAGHVGYVYRAMNWHYAGQTDSDRKTPRFDLVTVRGGHSRDAYRTGNTGERVPRKPKSRYWQVTGNRTERRRLAGICGWPSLDWGVAP